MLVNLSLDQMEAVVSALGEWLETNREYKNIVGKCSSVKVVKEYLENKLEASHVPETTDKGN